MQKSGIKKNSIADTLGWTEDDIEALKYQLAQVKVANNEKLTPSLTITATNYNLRKKA